MTTAFVLSGGGSLGAVQVGMLQGLADRGMRPDVLIGASAGALNAAFVAARGWDGGALDDLEGIWRGLRRQDVFPFAPARHLLALAGARPSLCSRAGLERLLEQHLGDLDFGEARVPVHVVATDVLSGRERLLSSGPLAPAVLASAAIPAVFPPVEVDGAVLFDGGVANNTPISHAVALGADRVVVLPTGYACDLHAAPPTALAAAVHALTLLVAQRLVRDVEDYEDLVDLVVVPPLCPLSVSSADFRHGGELIERARRATDDWFETGGPARPQAARFLSLHDHRTRRPCADCSGGHAA